jgi:DNA-binding CsgD family transcriptional regulator
VKLASGDVSRGRQYLIDGDHLPIDHEVTPHLDPYAGDSLHITDNLNTTDNIAHLALMLMAELGACLQMISSDIARATDLSDASTRWLQRLTALMALIERAGGTYPNGKTEPHAEHHLPELTHSGARLPKLTAREAQIMALTRKGFRPRTIARRLQLSVETVYTHLRNARRKERFLESQRSM